MFNSTDHLDDLALLNYVTLIKRITFSMLMLLALLSLSACQSTSSVVKARPAKPIMTIPSTGQTTDKPNQANKVIFIESPPPTVPTTVVINRPNGTASRDKVDILTSPSPSRRDDNQATNTNRISSADNTTASDSNQPLPNHPPIVIRGEHPNNSETTSTQPPVQPSTRPTRSSQDHTTQPHVEAPVENIPVLDRRTPQEILLERARANTNSQAGQATPTTVLENGDNVPAFRRLMQTGIGQFQNGDYSNADSTFTRAQRLAPQSATVYYYLGQVALKRHQPKRAEAMARRGLVVAQTNSQRQQLWQVILLSGEIQQSPRVITEAQTALGAL